MKSFSALRVVILSSTLVVSALAQGVGGNVAAVEGESWLSHLRRPLQETSMGYTGRSGPGPESASDSAALPAELAGGTLPDQVNLHPEDLYRLNCRSCHGGSGQGAPPEINSIINPVRATSLRLVMERMHNAGMDMKSSDAAQVARQSKDALLQRIHHGGDNMPAFSQLNEVEVQALLAYLNQLAGVSTTIPAITIKEHGLRVGELIVRSTCHICHGAEGENPSPQQMLDGAIPPLSVLTTRVNHAQFIRKVTHGAPVKMGSIPMMYRGRMPVFYYLTPQEAEYVYQYLSLTSVQMAKQDKFAGLTAPPSADAGPATYSTMSVANSTPDVLAGPLSAIGVLAFMLFAAGVWFTMRELKRLSTDINQRPPESLRPVRVESLGRDKELESAG
jgi:mono/diheme cytochrome c family protein